MRKILTTYKTWRITHNPWMNNNFIGYLDPTNQEDLIIINEIHDYIDKLFEPRFLGVTNQDRFLQLMLSKLKSIESNFYNSFRLDSHYDLLEDMLKNIDMLSDTNTDTNLSGTNTGTINNKRTDNLVSTKSAREDTRDDTSNSVETDGARQDTQNISNDGNITKETTYGKKDTLSGTDTTTNTGTDTSQGRAVNSQYPQSNIGDTTVGIDAPLAWDYATAGSDSKQTINKNDVSKTDYGRVDTLSGTDKDVTTDKSSQTTTSDKGEQINKINADLMSTFNEGEQSVTNTGTQDNNQTENREHTQTGKYKKINNNAGRTDNLAKIRQEWRDLLHTTISAYSYLFNELDSLFYNLWDVDECYYEII